MAEGLLGLLNVAKEARLEHKVRSLVGVERRPPTVVGGLLMFLCLILDGLMGTALSP